MLSSIVYSCFTDVATLRDRYKVKGKEIDAFTIAVMQSELNSQRILADDQITELMSCVGGAERIVRTTVPSSYSRHTSRFLSIWCFTLVRPSHALCCAMLRDAAHPGRACTLLR